MKTVNDNTWEIEVNKSRFIGLVYNINKIEDIPPILENTKKIYSDATHICYAYIVEGKEKVSDDLEPAGTAGMPILNVLKKEGLENVLCIVVRYFGGIKLGAGGLVRAYSKACREALKIVIKDEAYVISTTFTYDFLKRIDYLLKTSIIIDKNFLENVTYIFKIRMSDYENIKDELNRISKVKKISKTYI